MLARSIKQTGLGLAAVAWLLVAPPAQAVTFDLCAATGTVTMPGGAIVPIWGFALDTGGGCGAATLPGPVLEATVGDTVNVNLSNQLAENVAIMFRGQSIKPDLVGAGPGGSTSYTFTASAPGTFLYEAGTNPGIQIPMGLYGALVVRPVTPGQAYGDPSTAFDAEAVLVLSEIDPALNAAPTTFDLLDYRPLYWLINGEAHPDTGTIPAAGGARLLLRYLNAGPSHLTMTLLGARQVVIAKDAFPLSYPTDLVAETIPSGQTVDAITTLPAGVAGTRFPLYNRQLYLNSGFVPVGQLVNPTSGMLTFIELTAPVRPAGASGNSPVPVPRAPQAREKRTSVADRTATTNTSDLSGGSR
jgi:FtsP/CotA-like multicopper oxidase with cupredoxin domain